MGWVRDGRAYSVGIMGRVNTKSGRNLRVHLARLKVVWRMGLWLPRNDRKRRRQSRRPDDANRNNVIAAAEKVIISRDFIETNLMRVFRLDCGTPSDITLVRASWVGLLWTEGM